MSIGKKIKISFIVALFASIVFSVISFSETSEEIRKSFIRLHVIANSDTSVDQNLKLAVRDFLLAEGDEIFDGTVNIENAKSMIIPRLKVLNESVNMYVRSRGFDYEVKVELKEEYFTTRTYNKVTLPAGKYLALKVVIGEGKGKNWWCVMFPPMCISAADEETVLKNNISGKEFDLVNRNPKYEVRFKIIELIEDIKFKFQNT